MLSLAPDCHWCSNVLYIVLDLLGIQWSDSCSKGIIITFIHSWVLLVACDNGPYYYFPRTDCGIDIIAIIIDHLSRYTYFVSFSTLIYADELVLVFLATVFDWHWVPERIILDHDPCFLSVFLKGFVSVFRA